MKEKDWFRLKKYPHIGLPLENKDRHKWVESYITNKDSIAKHRFLPFIHKVSKKEDIEKNMMNLGIKSNIQLMENFEIGIKK